MSTEINILLPLTGPTFLSYSEKQKGAGYNKNNNGIHTVVYQLNEFVGTVKIQATLALDPSDNDWVDVHGSDIIVDDVPLTSNETVTFEGRFVWIRAAYIVNSGSITEIRYSY